MKTWLCHKEEFKQILRRNDSPEDELTSVIATKAELIPFLKRESCFMALDREILHQLEQSTTFYGFNCVLNAIYDYADEHKIWLGI